MPEIFPGLPYTSATADPITAFVGESNDHQEDIQLSDGSAADIVNVSSEGIEPGTDIRESFAALIASGGRFYIPDGEYSKSGTAIPVQSNTELIFGPNAIIKNATGSNAPILSNSDRTNGNTNIIIRGGKFDGNRANQTGQYSVLDFQRVTNSRFIGCDIQGGKRNASFPNGTEGEGIVLRYSDRNFVLNCYSHDNDYDGIKLRSSKYNVINGNVCAENGRSGIQISFQATNTSPPYNDNEGVYSAGSNFNTITNNTITHSTGTPTSVSPTNSGIYLHTGSNNTISGNVIHGPRQGIGVYYGSLENSIVSNVIAYRYVDKAGIDVEGGTGKNNRNRIIGNTVSAIAGTNPMHARINEGDSNLFFGNTYLMNGATGTPTREVTGSSSTGNRLLFESSDGTFTDNGTTTTIIVSSGSVASSLLFGAAGDVQLSRTAASVLSLGADDVIRTGRNVTASRPSASTVGAGAMFFDTTLAKPIWSDGTNWKDATGTNA